MTERRRRRITCCQGAGVRGSYADSIADAMTLTGGGCLQLGVGRLAGCRDGCRRAKSP